jgi:ABC-type multidrug transport system ATPase subunit
MESVLSLNLISKNYGRIQALKEVSFDVPPGSVFGILGPNGSGKTTLLGIVMDVLQKSGGTYKWFGEPGSDKQRKEIGTLLETPNFYHYLSAQHNLEITAAIKNKPKVDIERVLKIVRLYERKDSKFQTFSLGMKQRLAIAACLLGNPSVLVFDEPTNGLDPSGIAEIRQLILDLAKGGKTIILASHLLAEVEKVCTHAAILQQGMLLKSGDVLSVLNRQEWMEVGATNMAALKSVLAALPGINKIVDSGSYFQVSFHSGLPDAAWLNGHCFEQGIVLNFLQIRKESLESAFIELTNNVSN